MKRYVLYATPYYEERFKRCGSENKTNQTLSRRSSSLGRDTITTPAQLIVVVNITSFGTLPHVAYNVVFLSLSV